MTPNPNPSPELHEALTTWLRDRLLYAIQFHMWDAATAEEVEQIIDSLSDSDEYDPNVVALVQMPKWCSPCEAQQGVDAFFGSPQTLPAPGEVDHIADAGNMVEVERIKRAIWGYVNAQPEDAATLPVVQFLANRDVFLAEAITTVAAANDEGVAEAFARGVEAAAQIAERIPTDPAVPKYTLDAHIRVGGSIAADIRLLSQGGGKA